MSKVEQKKLLSAMKKRTAKATVNKKAAVEYLIELGVLTKTGNYTKPYRSLCIKSKAA